MIAKRIWPSHTMFHFRTKSLSILVPWVYFSTDKVNNIIMIIIIRHNLQGQLGKNYYFDINLMYLTIFCEIEVNSRARETLALVKITPREKRRHENFSLFPPRLPFLAWDDFHARSRFAHSTIPEDKWGLLVVYVFLCSGEHCFELQLITSQ